MAKLAVWCAERKRTIFDRLREGLEPGEGRFDESVWREGAKRGSPQMGTTVFAPDSVTFEFIYPDAIVLSVALTPPERVVFLNVPAWVVESIWQGEIFGSTVFESEAQLMVDEFLAGLTPENNAGLFGPRSVVGKD